MVKSLGFQADSYCGPARLPLGRSSSNMFFAYVLLSLKDKKRYYGLTNNLRRRVSDHNSGKVNSTKLRRPLKLIYFENFETQLEARKRELYFKSGYGREFLNKKLNRGPVV